MVIWDVAKLVISRLSLPLTSPSFIEFCQIITIWKNSKNKISSLACSQKIKKNRLMVSFSRMSVRQIIRRYRLKSFVDGNTGTGSILPGLDLRSDTITMPSQEIRQIMASAKVKNLKIQNEVNLTGRSFVKCSNGFLHFKAKFSLRRFTFSSTHVRTFSTWLFPVLTENAWKVQKIMIINPPVPLWRFFAIDPVISLPKIFFSHVSHM